MSGDPDSVAALSRGLAQRLRGLRRRTAMNYSVNFTELTALLEVIDSLAPEFEAAFRVAGQASLSAVAGRRVEGAEAVRALGAVVAERQDDWFLRLMLAYYLVLEAGDERAAAAELKRAGQSADAPAYVRALGLRLSGTSVLDDAAGDSGQEPRLVRALSQIQTRVDQYREQHGRLPGALDEVLQDPKGELLREDLEVELVIGPDGLVTTREHQVRESVARERSAQFQRVKPYVVPNY